jgi:hypothetical protein
MVWTSSSTCIEQEIGLGPSLREAAAGPGAKNPSDVTGPMTVTDDDLHSTQTASERLGDCLGPGPGIHINRTCGFEPAGCQLLPPLPFKLCSNSLEFPKPAGPCPETRLAGL